MDYNWQGEIDENLRLINAAISEAAVVSGRSGGDVALCAVTKTVPVERINYAISRGVRLIGENRVQELLSKYDHLDRRADIHLIGHLQTNKVKYIIDKVSMIQSLDSLGLAQEIDRQAKKAGRVMDVLMEVNVGGEESKFGFDPSETVEISAELAKYGSIRLRGVMAIPPIAPNNECISKYFQTINQIYIDIMNKNKDNSNINILSYGMSGDYPQAVRLGSNLVRLGRAIFGARQ